MTSNEIDITIIIPCRNEQNYIGEAIRRIELQDGMGADFSYELLIVDGESDDGTVEVVEKERQDNDNIRLLKNEKKVTPCAFNLGIKNARGRYICILGAHAEIESDYIAKCYKAMRDNDVDNVGGPWKAKGRGYVGGAIAEAFQSQAAMGGARSRDLDFSGDVNTVWGGFYKREVFEKIGLFDEELIRNQDDELNFRLVKSGGKIHQSPDIRFSYYCRDRLRDLFKQYYQYGYWKVRVIQKHNMPASPRHLIPGTFVFLLLLLSAASVVSRIALLGLGSLLLLYGLFLIGASVLICVKPGSFKYLPVMPAVIAVFHIAYGLGFLKGGLDFVILKKHKRGRLKDMPLTR